MNNWKRMTGLLLVALALMTACTSNIRVSDDFPVMVTEPRDMSAALVMSPEFRTFQAQPNSQTRIQLGAAQVVALRNAFMGLFAEVTVVGSRAEVAPGTDMVITPTVLDVQLSTPSESYLNVFELWIKYNLDIESYEGVAIDSWFLPAYGKTPYSYLLSRTTAIESAAVVALRDAGAKLVLDFFRIPAVYGWIQENKAQETAP